jgi:hypothetical protein
MMQPMTRQSVFMGKPDTQNVCSNCRETRDNCDASLSGITWDGSEGMIRCRYWRRMAGDR